MPIKLKAMEASAIWKHHSKQLKTVLSFNLEVNAIIYPSLKENKP
jgi:hypothetical protein